MNQCNYCKHYEEINHGCGKCKISKNTMWFNAICKKFSRKEKGLDYGKH